MISYKKVYLIGIGGIGMSALAKLMVDAGIEVFGSDRASNEMTDKLKEYGIDINIGHDEKNIDESFDCVVYTLAISEDNPELLKAKELNLPVFTYAEMLGEVSKDYFTVAVSGTHGKTTTTAMLAKIFEGNDRKPNVIVGSVLKDHDSNYIKGEENIFIVEACEYKKSFLNLDPNILIITNIDSDHLDFYKNLQGVQNAFEELIEKMPKEGIIVCDPEDPKVKPILTGKQQKIIDYKDFKEGVPENILGDHNIMNAAAAKAAAAECDILEKDSNEALKDFEGAWRRLQCIGKTKEGALVYDDYAHHPSEIKATIKTLQQRFSDKKIILIFQPHTYSRTHMLFNDFIKSLQGVEELVLLPIYAAREKNEWNVSSQKLIDAVSKNQNSLFLESFDSILDYLKDKKGEEYLIITMGAGDVYKITDKLV